MKLLIKKGADVNAKDNSKDGKTALLLAASAGQKDVVKLLIEKCAKLEAKDSEGGTALLWAASEGHKDVVELLIERHADVNAKEKFSATQH